MKRTPGLGVRAKTVMEGKVSEFVIRESNTGNETLSLINVDGLIQVVTSKRDQIGTITLEKHMITKNVETFSHFRYDWLDTTKFIWWASTALGLILLLSSIFISSLGGSLGAILFFVGLLLTLMQAADPEYIVFETSSGAHRFLVYRMGSNLPLTNISMDLVDNAMQEYLRTGKLDTTLLDAEAERIESERLVGISYTTPPPSQPPSELPGAPPSNPPPPLLSEPPSAPPSNPPPPLLSEPPSEPPSAPPSNPPPPLLSEPPSELPSPPPMVPPSNSGPPLMAPPPSSSPSAGSDFSDIPAPPPVDFSDIPNPPNVKDLETVTKEDKEELLDVLK
jgi:hypothetical protein